MAYDAYLKLDGITGESNAANHQGETEIYSFSFGIRQVGVSEPHGSVREASFIKSLDSISATLFQKCATGDHIATAVLSLDNTVGASSLPFATYTMSDVMIVSVRPTGSTKGDKPLEEFTLNFTKLEWKRA
jgi:type VI secretion system secreted protein Hcp